MRTQLLGTAALLATLPACNDESLTHELPAATSTVPALDWQALQHGNRGAECDAGELEARVDALLGRMTLEQKVFQMRGLQLTAIDGLYYAGGNAELGLPPFKMIDGPRGVRAGNATAFPVGMARGATWDPELERRVGEAIGREAAAKGANVVLAPTINILRHPAWGRAQETYSEDATHMARMAVGFIAGVQNHVLASAKHFAGNSIENSRFTVSVDLDERTLREVYLPHFERAVSEAHVASVMSAYNRVNGVYSAENTHLLRDILRNDWAFRGFVESDWILGTRSTAPSLAAGLDIEMPAGIYYGEPLLTVARTDPNAAAAVDRSVRRILRQKLCFGLERPAALDPAVVENPDHVALAREVAEKSLVLLKNADGVLPLRADWSGTIAIVGELAKVANLGDHGSSSVTPSQAVTPLQALEAAAPSVHFVEVLTDTPSEDELARISEADVAIVVTGLTYEDEGEFIPTAQGSEGLARGGDRVSLELPSQRAELIERVSARRSSVVLEGGSAILVRRWVDAVDALVMAWYPGMQGGTALANVLFGNVNPSGKLPITFARDAGDLPPWSNTSEHVAYDYYHGYRLFDKTQKEPEFPFGFGLSYSRFRLARLELDRQKAARDDVVTVRVDVGNVGERAGDEVVQVYASYPGSSVDRPLRELKAFRRVSLDPGEVKTVELEVKVSDLAYFDVSRARWIVEALAYRLYVGTSSRDLPLEASFLVTDQP